MTDLENGQGREIPVVPRLENPPAATTIVQDQLSDFQANRQGQRPPTATLQDQDHLTFNTDIFGERPKPPGDRAHNPLGGRPEDRPSGDPSAALSVLESLRPVAEILNQASTVSRHAPRAGAIAPILDSIDVTNHFRNGRIEEGTLAAARLGYQAMGARAGLMGCAAFGPLVQFGCVVAGTYTGGVVFDVVSAQARAGRPMVHIPPLAYPAPDRPANTLR